MGLSFAKYHILQLLAPLTHLNRFLGRPIFSELSKCRAAVAVGLNFFLLANFYFHPGRAFGVALFALLGIFIFRRKLSSSRIYFFAWPSRVVFEWLAKRTYVRFFERRADFRYDRNVLPFLDEIRRFAENSRTDFSLGEVEALHLHLERRGSVLSVPILAEILRRESLEISARRLADRILNHDAHLKVSTDSHGWARAYVDLNGEDVRKSHLLALVFVDQKLEMPGSMTALAFAKMSIEAEIAARVEKRKLVHVAQMLNGNFPDRLEMTDVDVMSGHEFELFLESLFRDLGFSVRPTRQTGDQGADLVLEKFGSRAVVQAKRYTEFVGNKAVQEVVAAKAHYDCDDALVVTNCYFTRSAIELATSNHVALWDREHLASLLSRYPQKRRPVFHRAI